MTTDFIVGGLARNEDFCFRQDFVDELWDILRKQNVLLLAPRRMGKTSIMYRLLEQPRHNFHVIHLNVEPLETPADFFISLIDAFNEHQPALLRELLLASWKPVKQALGRLEEIELLDFKIKLRKADDWDNNWSSLAEQFMQRVESSNQHILFIIDELPDLITAMQDYSMDELNHFLHSFRAIRQDPAHSKIRWLVGGSVNIRGTLDEIGQLKTINDFDTEILRPLNASEVEQFVTMMLSDREVEFAPDLIQKVQDLLGNPIPFFLQLFTQELYRYWRRQGHKPLTTENAKQVFEHSLLGEAAHNKLQHFHSRIRLHYPPHEQNAAYGLLDQLSLSDKGISRQSLFHRYTELEQQTPSPRKGQALKDGFQHLLQRLQSDFYVEQQSDDALDFTSHLLKVWWRRNYGYDAD